MLRPGEGKEAGSRGNTPSKGLFRMNYQSSRYDGFTDLRQTLLEQALHKMVCDENSGPPKLRAPLSSCNRTMFSCIPDRDARAWLEPVAQWHKLNVIAAVESSAGLTFDLGVRLSWNMLWHESFLLWEGSDECVFFVPEDLSSDLRFWIEEGDLHRDKGLPFANRADRETGLDVASRRLAALIGKA